MQKELCLAFSKYSAVIISRVRYQLGSISIGLCICLGTCLHVCNIGQYPHPTYAGICRAYDKRAELITTAVYYPFVEATLIVNESTLFVDMVDRPLLHVAEGKAVRVIFARQTDMAHIDKCFRGQSTFEEDMRHERPAAGSE